MFDITDKVVVIVGANRLCGQYLTRELSEQNACVCSVVVDNVNDGDQINAQLTEFMDQIAERHGGIDILLCDVRAELPKGAVCSFDAQQWSDAITETAYTCWKAARHAVPHMRGRKDAVIVFLTYADHRHLTADRAMSAVCSAGIDMMTKLMASELAEAGIRVCAVNAGSDRSAEEICGAVEFLADSAASYITGTSFEVSGISSKAAMDWVELE